MGSVGNNGKDLLSCHMCNVDLGPTKSSPLSTKRSKKVKTSHLWRYLYHQNVRESISYGGDNCADETGLPQLTFTLSSGGATCHAEESAKEIPDFCVDCSRELETLENLHKELVGIKKKIESKVRMINRRQHATWKHGQGPALFSQHPKFQVSLAGSVMGKEKISQALGFLTTICNGMSTEDTTRESLNPAKLEPDSEIQPPHDEPAPCSSNRSFTATNGRDDLESVMQVEVDQVEILTGIVKTENPDGIDIVLLQPEVTSEDTCEVDDGQDSFLLPHYVAEESMEDPLTLPDIPVSRDVPSILESAPIRPIDTAGLLPKPQHTFCTVCGREMLTKNLRHHMTVHTKEKKYHCDICGIKFTHPSSVYRHQRRVHGVQNGR